MAEDSNILINIRIPSMRGRRGKGMTSLTFALGMVFFFFTFFDVNCNNQKLMSVSGIDLVVGMEKPSILGQTPTNNDNDLKPNVFAVLALLSAAGAAIGIQASKRKARTWGVTFGTLSFLGMLGLYWNINAGVQEANGLMSADFKFPFYASIIAFLAGTVISTRLKRPQEPVNLPLSEDSIDSVQKE